MDIEDRYGAHNYHPLDVVVARAEGVWVYDVDGKKYLDCLAAYSAVNQGHCHPRIVKALKDQAGELALTSRAFRNNQLGPYCKMLSEMAGMDRVLPMNTGAEAVETAIKAARKWGYQVKGIAGDAAEIIVFDGNFHGRTTTIVGFSTDEQSRDGFGPFTPGFRIVKYNDIEAVRAAMNDNTCAVIIEPIQGEGGVVIPDDGYMKGVWDLCRETNVPFIADEIQSGLGRTGKMFCYEWDDIKPDGVIVGKALSGGMYPVSAFLANDAVMNVFTPGDHGSTYGGNPLACAVAIEALNVLRDEKLVERSAELGPYFIDKLRSIKSDRIVEVRGRGLWIAIVLDSAARSDCEALKGRGILCKETHENIIRIAPPLVITKEEIDWAFDRIKGVLETPAAAKA